MFHSILNPATLVFLIPLAAIIGHFMVKAQQARYEHEERLEKIRAGIDPDYEDEEEEEFESVL